MSETPITDAFNRWFLAFFPDKFDPTDSVHMWLHEAFLAGANWCKAAISEPDIFEKFADKEGKH